MAAILAFFGQLLASVIPIWLGPSDLIDFNINIDRVYYKIGISRSNFGLINIQSIDPSPTTSTNNLEVRNNTIVIYSTIEVNNLQPWIKPYPHTVFIKAINIPK